MTSAFQAPPSDLKALAPFLQRAHETKTADSALSYWCNYHAAQLGIPLLSSLQPSSKIFLMNLMDTLETQKKSLADNDVVTGDDLVAKAYVENVALKVFAGADNEDRSGKASKGTAKKFLAAANFIEVLGNFGALERNMEEKLKYSKWKATDIAKALREGRKPNPGALGEAEAEERDRDNVEAMTGTEEAAARLANLSAIHPDKEQDYVDREMAKLVAGESLNETDRTLDQNDHTVTAISPPDDVESEYRDLTMRRAQSQLSFDGRETTSMDQGSAAPIMPIGSPNFSRPLSTHSPSFNMSESSFPPQNGISTTSSPSPRPLPMPPSTSSNFRREGLPIPPGGQGSVTPLTPPPHILSPGLPSQPSFLPSHPSQPQIPTAPSYPSAPPPPPAAPAATPIILPTPTTASYPTTLDSSSISRVQKLARWAISALDYDDIETAMTHLREALDMCEGRALAPTTRR